MDYGKFKFNSPIEGSLFEFVVSKACLEAAAWSSKWHHLEGACWGSTLELISSNNSTNKIVVEIGSPNDKNWTSILYNYYNFYNYVSLMVQFLHLHKFEDSNFTIEC